jgi:hypothetical protein
LVTREIVRTLAARDSVEGSRVIFQPGTLLQDCRIVRSNEEPYAMEFAVKGLHYTCPLFQFQSRTQVKVEQPLEIAMAAKLAVQR